MDTQYSQSGSYLAIAGLVALILAHFGINTTVDTIVTIIGGIFALIGVIQQGINHKQMAIAAGAYPKK